MNCRDFLAEFEERNNALTQSAQFHLKECPNCGKMSREQTRVWRMIDGLQRVDAPTDFDFHVKARIAKSKSAAFQQRFFPVLRYVLPLGLVVLILGAVIFNTTDFRDSNSTQIVESLPQMPVAGQTSSGNFSTPEQIVVVATPQQPSPNENTVAENLNLKPAASEKEIQFVAEKSTKKLLTESRKANPKNSGGGSREFSLTSPDAPKLPLGINPNQTIEPSPNTGNLNPITDVQILDFIGIETVSEKGGKKVKAVKPDSLAERSGVEPGDLVEAIDGKRIGDKAFVLDTAEIKKLTVSRGAAKKEIVLQNKSN